MTLKLSMVSSSPAVPYLAKSIINKTTTINQISSKNLIKINNNYNQINNNSDLINYYNLKKYYNKKHNNNKYLFISSIDNNNNNSNNSNYLSWYKNEEKSPQTIDDDILNGNGGAAIKIDNIINKSTMITGRILINNNSLINYNSKFNVNKKNRTLISKFYNSNLIKFNYYNKLRKNLKSYKKVRLKFYNNFNKYRINNKNNNYKNLNRIVKRSNNNNDYLNSFNNNNKLKFSEKIQLIKNNNQKNDNLLDIKNSKIFLLNSTKILRNESLLRQPIKFLDNTISNNSSSNSSTNSSYNNSDEKSFLQKYGTKIAIVGIVITLTGLFAVILIALLRYHYRLHHRATGALALPIPLLPEESTPFNAEPEHPVPMLSVQSAGCAGMERLGVPARTSINSPSDDRGHISRRMRVDAIQARDIIVRDATMLSDRQIRNNHHNYHHRSGGCAVSGVRGVDSCSGVIGASAIPVQSSEKHNKSQQQYQQQQQHQITKTQNVIRCPHHVPLPDSEWGQDRDLQIRPRYQNSEIVRTYITPPPNKTVLDVPEQSFNLYTSSGISCNLGANYNNLQQYYQQQNNNNHHNHTNYHQHQQAQQQQQQQKSKPNVIQKLFSRKSSPKSPQPSPTLLSSSSCSSVASSASSTSSSTSSSSSLSCTIALPISTASALTTTSCNLGTNIIGPSSVTHQSITSASQQQQQMLQQSTSLSIGNVSIPLLSLGTAPSVPTHTIDNDDDNDIDGSAPTIKSQSLASIDILNDATTAAATSASTTNSNINYKYDQLIRIDNNTTLSTNPSIASSTTLQLYKSKSCNLSQISLASSSTSSSMGSLSPHSTDCCYTQATNVRPRINLQPLRPKIPITIDCHNSNNNGNGKQQKQHHNV